MSGVTASFARGGSLRPLVLDITNTASPNIPNLLSAAGWKGTQQPVIIENSALVNTLVIPITLDGADITIVNKPGARIGGRRGSGTALRTQIPIKVDNQGTISGGGGFGGSVQYTLEYYNKFPKTSYAFSASGGVAQGFESSYTLTLSGGGGGVILNATTIGEGLTPNAVPVWPDDTFEVFVTFNKRGGSGGSWGSPGTDAYTTGDTTWVESGSGWSVAYPGLGNSLANIRVTRNILNPGGQAGYHTDGNNLVTWINAGTRLGRVKA